MMTILRRDGNGTRTAVKTEELRMTEASRPLAKLHFTDINAGVRRARDSQWNLDVESRFRASMIELSLLALLIVVLVASIYAVHARPANDAEAVEH